MVRNIRKLFSFERYPPIGAPDVEDVYCQFHLGRPSRPSSRLWGSNCRGHGLSFEFGIAGRGAPGGAAGGQEEQHEEQEDEENGL